MIQSTIGIRADYFCCYEEYLLLLNKTKKICPGFSLEKLSLFAVDMPICTVPPSHLLSTSIISCVLMFSTAWRFCFADTFSTENRPAVP